MSRLSNGWPVLLMFVRSFSTSSRPALRAAGGRPPARPQLNGHRGAGLASPDCGDGVALTFAQPVLLDRFVEPEPVHYPTSFFGT